MFSRLLLRFLATAILITGMPGISRVAEVDCEPPSAERIQSLIQWIGEHSDYDVSATLAAPPEIQFCVMGEEIEYDSNTTIVEPNDAGMYDVRNNRIFLVMPWDVNDPRDLAVLLHELVHAIQFSNRPWECLNASEWQAYKLQEAWLLEQNIDPGFDWLLIFFQSRCPRDIHP